MYKFIGGDGKEYGPVTADQLRLWISEGRANAESRVQLEGTAEWKTIGELPEFEDAVRAPAPPPATAARPPREAGEAEQLAEAILARDYEVNIPDCIGRGWQLLTGNFWPLVGVTLLVVLLEVAVVSVPSGLPSLFLDGVLQGGLYWYFLKMVREREATVADAFAGFSLAFVQLMLVGLVSTLLTMVGFLLLILPGIYLAVCWSFAIPLVIDKRFEFWPAMELSRKVVHRHWWAVFGFLLVCLLLVLAGALVCLVGLAVTLPLVMGATVYLYEDIFSATAVGPGEPRETSEVESP